MHLLYVISSVFPNPMVAGRKMLGVQLTACQHSFLLALDDSICDRFIQNDFIWNLFPHT